MTLNQLASQITKQEKKKVSVSIGNVREILKILVDIEMEALFGKGDRPITALLNAVQVKIKQRNTKPKQTTKGKTA